MQNIKNFKSVLPSVLDAQIFGESVNSIHFLMSDDGLDWYECQALFADDTIKIMYDADGVICSVVDKPVRERGNTHAVSMFFPLNMSVAEVAAADYPAECKADGLWVFDGTRIDKRIFTPQEIVVKNSRIYEYLLRTATDTAFPLQAAVSLGCSTPEQQQALKALQQYSLALASTDRTVMPANWPALPEMLTCGSA